MAAAAVAGRPGGRRLAVLIGVADYVELPPLRCPAADVRRMAALLGDPKLGGFDDVVCFVEGESAADILTRVETVLTDDAQNGDAVLIYFSGHGKMDRHGQLYLATRGTTDRALDATSIAFDRLARYVSRSRCQSNLLILDCCYSGAIRGSVAKGDVKDAVVSASNGRGLFCMTSCTDAQVSHEKEGDELSLYTRFLAEGLETGHADVNGDGWISCGEAQAYAAALVRGTGLQTPLLFMADADGDFILGRNRARVSIDPSKLSGDDFRAFAAVKQMIEAMGYDEPPKFFIVFVPGRGYDIEGFFYRASGLTVTPDHTPNMRMAGGGFECDAFFPPRMIQPATREGREVGANGLVKVRLGVALADIMIVTGRMAAGGGDQVTMFNRHSG